MGGPGSGLGTSRLETRFVERPFVAGRIVSDDVHDEAVLAGHHLMWFSRLEDECISGDDGLAATGVAYDSVAAYHMVELPLSSVLHPVQSLVCRRARGSSRSPPSSLARTLE
jgi:hypothetical protein